MAIVGPTLVNGTWFNTANLGTYNTNAGTNTYTVSLVAGRRYFMTIESFSAGAQELPSSVTHDPDGTPLAFTLVSAGGVDASLTGFPSGSNTFAVWMVDVPSSTATALIRIVFPATQSACGAGLSYITGEDDTGTIVQVVKATGTSTTPAVTMAAFGATGNLLLFAACRDDIGVSINPTEGRSQRYENPESERNVHVLHYQNPNGGDTSVNASMPTSDDWAAIGIEVKEEAAAVAALYDADMTNPLYNSLLRM